MNNTKTLVALGTTQIKEKQNRKQNTESKHDVQHGPHKNMWAKHRCARRIGISLQHNGEKKGEKKDKQLQLYIQKNTQKTKDRATRIH